MKLFKVGRDRDIFDLITILLALLAFLLSIAFPLYDRHMRNVDESPAAVISGYHSYLLDPEKYRDVIGRILDASSMISYLERVTQPIDLRDQFIGTFQFHLFSITARNIRNVPITLSDAQVYDLVTTAQDTNLVLRVFQLLSADAIDSKWSNTPIIYLAPYETKRFVITVGFVISDKKEDAENKTVAFEALQKERALRISAESLRFRFRDNIGQEIVSDAISMGQYPRLEI